MHFYFNRINGIIKLSLELEIQKSILYHQIPYKYRVYTPLTTDITLEKAPWEMIYSTIPGIPQSFANRILDVDVEKSMCFIKIVIIHVFWFISEVYHQYDAMIYPHQLQLGAQDEKSFGQNVVGFLSSLIGFVPDSDTQDDLILNDFEVPEMEDMRWQSLEIYLQDFIDAFKTGVMNSSKDPMDIIHAVQFIYSGLHAPKIQDGTTPVKYHVYTQLKTSPWLSRKLEEVCLSIEI